MFGVLKISLFGIFILLISINTFAQNTSNFCERERNLVEEILGQDFTVRYGSIVERPNYFESLSNEKLESALKEHSNVLFDRPVVDNDILSNYYFWPSHDKIVAQYHICRINAIKKITQHKIRRTVHNLKPIIQTNPNPPIPNKPSN